MKAVLPALAISSCAAQQSCSLSCRLAAKSLDSGWLRPQQLRLTPRPRSCCCSCSLPSTHLSWCSHRMPLRERHLRWPPMSSSKCCAAAPTPTRRGWLQLPASHGWQVRDLLGSLPTAARMLPAGLATACSQHRQAAQLLARAGAGLPAVCSQCRGGLPPAPKMHAGGEGGAFLAHSACPTSK